MAAFELLYRRYEGRVRRLLRRYLDTPEDVEDLLHDTFVRAMVAVRGFRGESSFFTWLYRIGVSVALNEIDRRRRVPVMWRIEACDDVLPDPAGTLGADPASGFATQRVQRDIERRSAALPGDVRDALYLSVARGLDYASIARLLDCPVGTVRSRISRARAALALAREVA